MKQNWIKPLQVGPRASAEILSGGQRRHIAYTFQAADVAMQMDVHKTLYPFHTTKMPHVTATVPKLHFISRNACFSLMLLFISYKTTWITAVLCNPFQFRSPLPSIASFPFILSWMHGQCGNNHSGVELLFIASLQETEENRYNIGELSS